MIEMGIYEKALPKGISWSERFNYAKELGFDFIEMSIDETDERIERLDWSNETRRNLCNEMNLFNIRIHSLCLSAHRRFPLGSKEENIRKQGMKIMKQAIDLANDLGIRIIQLAGYDVYYEEKTQQSREWFIQNLALSVNYAATKGVILAIEIMDDPFINSITKFLAIKDEIQSPYLQVYPDLGNLSAWPENQPGLELSKGIQNIVAVHLKDTYPVTDTYPGQFRDVPFGSGCVDFKGLFMTLNRLGYHGNFLIEMWNETDSEFIEKIQTAKNYLENLLKEAGYE